MKTINNIIPMSFPWQTKDPFLFCVHHEDAYPRGNGSLGPVASLAGRNIGQDFAGKDGWNMYHGQKVPGFPGHPHRGFETVTVVRSGWVDHSDSAGAKARYGNGDVQWMTAGRGLQHSEMFPLLNEDADNPLELFQIWLNLPKANKMVDPYFKMLWNKDIFKKEIQSAKGGKVLVEVFAGSYEKGSSPTPPPDSWAHNIENEVAIWNIKLEANAVFELPKASEGVNRSLYFYEGETVTVEGAEISHYHRVDLVPTVDAKIETKSKPASLLLLQGKPINEPVVKHGPFVMNTSEEIQAAFMDYQKDQFGGWPWDSSEPTHGDRPERFAIHSDGREERG